MTTETEDRLKRIERLVELNAANIEVLTENVSNLAKVSARQERHVQALERLAGIQQEARDEADDYLLDG